MPVRDHKARSLGVGTREISHAATQCQSRSTLCAPNEEKRNPLLFFPCILSFFDPPSRISTACQIFIAWRKPKKSAREEVNRETGSILAYYCVGDSGKSLPLSLSLSFSLAEPRSSQVTIRGRVAVRALENKEPREKSRACVALRIVLTRRLSRWDSPRDRSRTNERPITTIIRTCTFKERLGPCFSRQLAVSLQN